MRKVNVFTDSSLLLKAFLQYRNLQKGKIEKGKLVDYLTDNKSNKFTFESTLKRT